MYKLHPVKPWVCCENESDHLFQSSVALMLKVKAGQFEQSPVSSKDDLVLDSLIEKVRCDMLPKRRDKLCHLWKRPVKVFDRLVPLRMSFISSCSYNHPSIHGTSFCNANRSHLNQVYSHYPSPEYPATHFQTHQYFQTLPRPEHSPPTAPQ